MKILKEIRVPKESVNDEFLNVVAIPFKNGDKVSHSETILELETSKAIVTIEAEVDGYIQYLCEIGSEVKINTVVIKIWDEFNFEEKKVEVSGKNVSSELGEKKIVKLEFTFYSIKAEKLIEEKKIDKSLFENFDFVNEELVLSLLNNESKALESVTKIPIPKLKESIKSPINIDKFEVIKLTNSKKREIEYLSEIQQAGLVSVINIDIDTENVFENTNKSLKYFTDSALPLIVYECSRLLLKYPMFNSYYSDENIMRYKDINIGIAMDIDDGLKVVNLKNTNKLNLNDVDTEIYELALRYIDKKLTIEYLQDTTFTIAFRH